MLSVVIPVYKVEPYLRRCVDSVLGQTYTDLEIILVDDGSPDGCPAICDEYAQKDSRVKVIHQKNGGVSRARNAGLELAQGEYITFVDADDYIDSQMYEKMLEAAVRTGADVVETTYRYGKWDNEDSGELYRFSGVEAVGKMFREDRFWDGFSVSPCTKLFLRKTVGSRRFLEGCTMAEDALFVAQVMGNSASVVKLDRSFYNYYMSEESAVRSDYRPNHADEVDANEKILAEAECWGDETLRDYLRSRYLGLTVHHWVQCHQRRQQRAFAEKEKELRGKFLEAYGQNKRYLSQKERLKYGAVRWLPGIYAGVYGALRGRKRK